MSDMEKARLLAQFERKTEKARATVAAVDAEQYEAFKVFDRRQLSLLLCPVGEPFLSVKYSYMLYIVSAPSGRRLDLALSFALVTITGSNLLEVGNAIADERCSFVQQFDPKHWHKPKDESLPFVSSISYLMTRPQGANEENEHEAR